MKDDQDLNTHFAGIIEANPCIYNVLMIIKS